MTMRSPRQTALAFDHEGERFTLVFDMETIARFEDATDQSIFEAVGALGSGKPPKLSMMGALLQAALAEHHPEVTRGKAMAMLVIPEVQKLFAEGLAAAMPKAGDTGQPDAEDGDTPPANPPTRKRAGKG
jgi:hypothetical protein